MVTGGDLTSGGGHTVPSISRSFVTDVYTETYMLLLTNVIPIKVTKNQ